MILLTIKISSDVSSTFLRSNFAVFTDKIGAPMAKEKAYIVINCPDSDSLIWRSEATSTNMPAIINSTVPTTKVLMMNQNNSLFFMYLIFLLFDIHNEGNELT